MSEIRRVLVTGAGGTVGSYIVGELLKRGYRVIATDLSAEVFDYSYWAKCSKDTKGSFGFGVADITDERSLERLFQFGKFDAVIHSAALIDVSLPKDLLMKVNLDAVKNLYEIFAKNGGKIFVFLSSGSIYGNDKILTETSPFEATSDYEESKLRAELFLDKRCAEKREKYPQVVTLRPSLIYGPRNKFLAATYLGIAVILSEFLKTKTPRFCFGPKTNLVHAEDVARAAVFLMENEKTWICGMNNAFNICDDSPLGFGDHLSKIIEAYDNDTLDIPLPLPPAVFLRLFRRVYESFVFINCFNGLSKGIWKEIIKRHNLEEGFLPEISRAMTPFFGQDTIFHNKKIKTFGFKLKYPNFSEGIKTVIPWYKKNKWIP